MAAARVFGFVVLLSAVTGVVTGVMRTKSTSTLNSPFLSTALPVKPTATTTATSTGLTKSQWKSSLTKTYGTGRPQHITTTPLSPSPPKATATSTAATIKQALLPVGHDRLLSKRLQHVANRDNLSNNLDNWMGFVSVSLLEEPNEPYQYPYLTEIDDLKGQSNVVPLDFTKAPSGECGSPLDINSKINCVAATVEDHGEPDDNQTKAEVMGEIDQRDPPVIGVPKSQADPPEQMSRKEFFQYVVNEAKLQGAKKGREVGIVAGYVAAKMEAIEKLKKKIQQEAEAMMAAETSAEPNEVMRKLSEASNLHLTSAVLHSLANGDSVNEPVLASNDDAFSDPENRSLQENMYKNVLPILHTAQEVGGALSAAGSLVNYVADELTRP